MHKIYTADIARLISMATNSPHTRGLHSLRKASAEFLFLIMATFSTDLVALVAAGDHIESTLDPTPLPPFDSYNKF